MSVRKPASIVGNSRLKVSAADTNSMLLTTMNTNHAHASWKLRALLALAVVTLSSCAMPPGDAWRMIQRDGLLNYWSYSSGHRPLYATRSSPPLLTGQSRSLAYRPPYARFGESWSPRTSTLPNRSLSSGRFSTPSAPSLTYSAPAPSTIQSPRRSTKPKVASSKPKAVNKPQEEEELVAQPRNPGTTPSKPAPSVAKNDTKPASPAAKPNDLPYGTAVPGRSNMVNSPYASKTQLVDVAGMSPGQTVKCPYSGKLFKVPPTQQQQASNKAEPKIAPKNDSDAPKSDSKAKSDAKDKSADKKN